jgi:hypothetical protein
MRKQRYLVSGPYASVLKGTSLALPLPAIAGHDEWLLDEALAETFPASDSIAVSPHSPASHKDT